MAKVWVVEPECICYRCDLGHITVPSEPPVSSSVTSGEVIISISQNGQELKKKNTRMTIGMCDST